MLNYSATIVGATEKYWCGIKHNKYNGLVEPKHHKNFLKYGDKNSFNRKFGKIYLFFYMDNNPNPLDIFTYNI